MKNGFISTLSLFTSFSTLICCALPALLVTLGLGASLAGLVSNVPFLVTLSKHKVLTFGVSGGLLIAAGILRWSQRNAPCPIDADKAKACMRLRKINAIIYWVAVGIYLTGVFFAFIAPRFI